MNKEYFLHSKTAEKWQKIGINRRAGTAVPLFSLYSSKSTGIGEIPDLKLLADWCVKTGISIIQLLPLNDVGDDFAPYNSVSSFAIDPMYISLENLKQTDTAPYIQQIERMRKKYRPILKKVNYRIKNAKLNLLWELYKNTETDNITELTEFTEKNSYWLKDYALFKVISSLNGGNNWQKWNDPLKNRTPEILEEIFINNFEKIRFHYWVQWQLSGQLKGVKQYASENNVLLKGDLPFLVSRQSADVWAHQNYFRLELSSGAPPDMYFSGGQKWGMPPYEWDNIAADDFTYLKEKLIYAGNFYDMYRIDHFVGLFRLWVSSAELNDSHGSYMPPEDYLWEAHGRKIIDVMLNCCNMMPCAEDLGTVPGCSYHTLYEYGIPGIDFQRYYKSNFHFRHPQEYRINSSAVVSTHDSSFWINWWKFEAGTIDEKLFELLCGKTGMDKGHFRYVKSCLFDKYTSRYGRLRWNENIDSTDKLKGILNLPDHESGDIVYLYLESYGEKDKFLNYLEISHETAEDSSKLVYRMLERINQSESIFSIQLIFEYLTLVPDILEKMGRWDFRLNTPGSVSRKNWSMILPVSLERLNDLEINKDIKQINISTGRSV